MSIEQALLARSQPYMLAAKVRELLHAEVYKGCLPDLVALPVALEPLYQPLFGTDGPATEGSSETYVLDDPPPEPELLRLRIWLSPQQTCTWERSELFLKQLSHVRRRVAFEILGNQECTALQLLCSRDDLATVTTAFSSQFEQCALSPVSDDFMRDVAAQDWAGARFRDIYPPPPYSHLLTRPDELKRSPHATLIAGLTSITPPAMGFFQVAFAPVSPHHNWHRNVRTLLDLEFSAKLVGGVPGAHRFAQQMPSGDLKQMAMDLEEKAHTDKPFFAAALRVGVVNGGGCSSSWLESLSLVGSLLQHGGRPLRWVTDEAYHRHLAPDVIGRMFRAGLTHRSGFLVNSWELASLVHMPPREITECHQDAMALLETLPAEESLAQGTSIGVCPYAGTSRPVCIPPGIRGKHVHLIGRPGMGKSTTMEYMILHDVGLGHGVAVLDPHGRLVQRLLCLLPAAHAERVIFLDPGDPEWVPIWNPFRVRGPTDHSRIADDLVRAFKSFVTGWGDRLEHLLRHAIYAVLHLPRGSLLDVSDILRQKSDESRQLRSMVLRFVDNEVSRRFWRNDFDRYRSPDLAPPQHKLSKLLTAGSAALMLSQTETSFDLQDVMGSGKILLVDLSTVGPETREILGCFLLSLLHLTALGRGSLYAETQLPFHVYCDEAHRFLTDAVEDLIAETRKFNVSLVLAHQYMKQFALRKADALSSTGATIIFNIDTRDAQLLRKDLRGLVELEDLITLDVGEAVARIGTHVVRLKTHPPLDIPDGHCRDLIIAGSRSRYCRRAEEVRRAIRARSQRWHEPLPLLGAGGIGAGEGQDGAGSDGEELQYDVF